MNDIFGYEWSDIQRAQQGGKLTRTIDASKPIDHSPTQKDLDLLALHGADGLESLGFAGTLDRLKRSGRI